MNHSIFKWSNFKKTHIWTDF